MKQGNKQKQLKMFQPNQQFVSEFPFYKAGDCIFANTINVIPITTTAMPRICKPETDSLKMSQPVNEARTTVPL